MLPEAQHIEMIRLGLFTEESVDQSTGHPIFTITPSWLIINESQGVLESKSFTQDETQTLRSAIETVLRSTLNDGHFDKIWTNLNGNLTAQPLQCPERYRTYSSWFMEEAVKQLDMPEMADLIQRSEADESLTLTNSGLLISEEVSKDLCDRKMAAIKREVREKGGYLALEDTRFPEAVKFAFEAGWPALEEARRSMWQAGKCLTETRVSEFLDAVSARVATGVVENMCAQRDQYSFGNEGTGGVVGVDPNSMTPLVFLSNGDGHLVAAPSATHIVVQGRHDDEVAWLQEFPTEDCRPSDLGRYISMH